MKKILILISFIFLLSGCWDYNELNDLAIIAGVGIDFEDDMYNVTFEILSTKKDGDTSGVTKAYTVSAKGKTITEAFMNNGNNMDKVAYYDHVEIVLVSEEVAKNHLDEVSEYIIRGSNFRNEIYLVVAKDSKAIDVLEATSKEKPVASIFISDLLKQSSKTSSAGYYEPFTKTLGYMLTDGEDAITSMVSVRNKEIVLDGMALFKDFKLVDSLDTNLASVQNLLNNFKANTVLFRKSCGNNKETVLSIYEAKVEIEPNNDKVVVKGRLNGRINEDACGYDFRQTKTYIELEKEFAKIIAWEMNKVIEIEKQNQVNSLRIGKTYYNTSRIKNFFLWTHQDFVYDLNLKINKKGLVFEVKDEK